MSFELLQLEQAQPEPSGLSSGELILGLVPLVGSIGTLALAFLAWRQLKQVRNQVDVARQGLESAVKASESAEESAREARRARIDDKAPRVVLWLSPFDNQPYIDPTRSTVQGGQKSLLASGESIQIAQGTQLSDPGDRNKILWYKADGLIINEGTSTARIRLDSACQFVSAEDVGYGVGDQPVSDPLQLGSDWFAQHLLLPGKAALFRWSAGKSVGDWMDLGMAPDRDRQRIRFHTVIAATDNSTIDHYYAELHLEPFTRSTNSSSTWIVRSAPGTYPVAHQHAPIRVYAAEGEHIPSPSWEKS